MLTYLSVDTETTGLDPERCQVLEVAAVAETDWTTPVEELPYLRLLVRHQVTTGEPAALAMNRRLLEELCAPGLDAVAPNSVADRLGEFVGMNFGSGGRHLPWLTLAGKNLAGFDFRFFRRLPNWAGSWFDRAVRHRVLDVGTLYLDPLSDAGLPDTAECRRRAGLAGGPAHTALEDARDVVRMVRARFANVEG